MPKEIRLFTAAAAAFCVMGAAQAQTPAAPTPSFPFVIPWDDASGGTATDVSSLNVRPAGAHGFITARGGHFVEAQTGRRVRFLGTNFVAGAAFPSHEDAVKVAARVAKLGINLVRLHHMDNDNWGPGQSLWDMSRQDHQHIDPAQLDKLDYLIAQFKKNGVYVNINLHVSRQFAPADGFPASVDKIPFGFDKRVDKFDRRMIALQKNYARDLLTHVNPYTHLSYAQDPCVAVIETNNENSLVGDPWATLGADLDTLPEPFRGELVGQWNGWLAKKYGTDAKVQAAWVRGVTPTGAGLLAHDSPWSIEHQGSSQASFVTGSDASRVPVISDLPLIGDLFKKPGKAPAQDIQVAVSQVDGTDWHVQVHQTGLNFRENDTYTVSFRAKADKPRTMNVNAGLDQDDYHNIGLSDNANLTPDWQMFRDTFNAQKVAPQHGRIAFVLGNQIGMVWISGLQVKPGAEGAGLQPGQSLAAKTVDIPTSATRPQRADWIAFLADTERAYADEMRDYLKDTLHVHANVIDSQISWGGLTGLYREAGSDFADNHSYWQHPSFPHAAWDPKDWNIPNTSMVADLANGGGGTLRDLAEYRVAGKPYTVSEYNEPAPNDFQAETLPVLATFAAYQDWDAVYLFDYGEYGTGKHNDQINGYFGIGSNPAKVAFLPAAAMIFRAGEMPPATSVYALTLPQSDLRGGAKAGDKWDHAADVNPVVNSGHRWQVQTALSVAAPNIVIADGYPRPSTGTLQVVKTGVGGQYLAVGPLAQMVAGYVGGETVHVGPATMTFPAFGNNFAAATLTRMPNKSLLLTLVGKVENQGMVWNADRTSVGDQWGHGPTVAEGIPATVMLKMTSLRHVYALDGTGHRAAPIAATFAAGALTFTVGPQDKTLWYEVAP